MAQPLRKTIRNIERVNYFDPSPTPTPTPSPKKPNTFRGKIFPLPQSELTYHGNHAKLGRSYPMKRDGGYAFILFEVFDFRKVADESQIGGITKTCDGEKRDVVLRDACKLWWWLGIALKYKTDLIKIGFVNEGFFAKLEYKYYSSLYSVNEKLYHQIIDYAAKRTPQPISCVVVEIDPDTHAGQNGSEYNIKVTQVRRKNGKLIHGGWTGEFWLDPNSKPWAVDDIMLGLQIARKAAKFGNRYYIENHMKLKNPPLDLNYGSPFWAKPGKYEEFKNIGLRGFNGIYCKDILYKLISRVFDKYCNSKKFDGYTFTVIINNNGNNIFMYGEDANEYIAHFGILPFLKRIGVQIQLDDDYISMILRKKLMEKEFNLNLIKRNRDNGQCILNDDVILKYHRTSSRIFVHKFSFKLENRHFVNARKNGKIK